MDLTKALRGSRSDTPACVLARRSHATLAGILNTIIQAQTALHHAHTKPGEGWRRPTAKAANASRSPFWRYIFSWRSSERLGQAAQPSFGPCLSRNDISCEPAWTSAWRARVRVRINHHHIVCALAFGDCFCVFSLCPLVMRPFGRGLVE